MQSCMYMKALNFELFSVLKTSQNTVRFCLFSRLNGYFLHNNTLAIILHVYIMILTWVESIFTLVICDNYTINIIFHSKYRWGSNFRSKTSATSRAISLRFSHDSNIFRSQLGRNMVVSPVWLGLYSDAVKRRLKVYVYPRLYTVYGNVPWQSPPPPPATPTPTPTPTATSKTAKILHKVHPIVESNPTTS